MSKGYQRIQNSLNANADIDWANRTQREEAIQARIDEAVAEERTRLAQEFRHALDESQDGD